MPVEKFEKKAIRVIKGDVGGTRSVASDNSSAVNVEFSRIYKGNDLKFDKRADGWLCIHNPGSSTITILVSKNGTGWTSDVVYNWMSVDANGYSTSMYTVTLAASSTTASQHNLAAGSKLYIRNANESQNFFNQDSNNYVRISSSGSHYVTGNWLALAPGARTSGTLSQYAFYKLFYGDTGLTSVPDFDNVVNGNCLSINTTSVFREMFSDCTALTRLPAFTVDTGGIDSVFYRTFYNCTAATSCGDLYTRGYGGHLYFQTYANCSSLLQGPYITGRFNEPYLRVYSYGMYQMFYGCTSMTSVRGITIVEVGEHGMEGTFANCTQFTGTGLSGRYYRYTPNELEQSDCADICLYGENSMKECFLNCTSMTRAFGAYKADGALGSSDILFQFCGSSGTGRLQGTFKNSGLSQNSFKCLHLGDVTTSGTREWSNYDLYQTFMGCTSITNAMGIFYSNNIYLSDRSTSRMDLATAGSYTFYEMFRGCTSLQYAKMPKVRYNGTYQMQNMFYGCTSLVRAYGTLPSSTTGIFNGMFYGCTSLIMGPIISQSNNALGFYQMFYNCSDLKYIVTAGGGLGNYSSMTQDWTRGTTNGTASVPRYFINLNSSVTYTSSDYNASGNTTSGSTFGIPYGWTIQNHPLAIMSNDGTAVSVKLYKYGTPSGTHSFNYLRLDNGTTGQYTPSTSPASVTSTAGVLFWGTSSNGSLSSSSSDYYRFQITGGSVAVAGNIRSLHVQDEHGTAKATSYCYHRLFYGCNAIEDASGLSGITGSGMSYNFSQMFEGCTGLILPPAISVAAGGSSYMLYRMFEGCTSLADPPTLENCTAASSAVGTFSYMFLNCTSLKSAATLPTASNVPMAEELFFGMYQGCTSLESVPSGYLPWGTTASRCYQYMFSGCTSLESVPNNLLSATSLSYMCYANMFEGCTSLAVGPDLVATSTNGTYAYNRLFYGCTSLSYIKVAFTTWRKADSTHRDTYDWTNSVPTAGVFWCPSSLAQSRNNSTNTGNSVSQTDGCNDTHASFIPYGWTIHNNNASSDWTDTDNMLIFTRVSGTVTLSATVNSDGSYGRQLQYTTNGIAWYNLTTSGVTLNSNVTKVGLRAASRLPDGGNNLTFSGSGKFDVSGNVTRFYRTHLGRLAGEEGTDATEMFAGCQNVRSCSGIYFTSTMISARSMFEGSSVTDISKTLLSERGHQPKGDGWNFSEMFRDCTSLTQGPDLYTTSPIRYRDFDSIFRGCTALLSPSSSPMELGQPTNDGTAVSTFAPEPDGKYHGAYASAFYGCTSIQEVKINFNYLGKDYDNHNLRHTFIDCFNGCSALSAIRTKQVRWPLLRCTDDWVDGVSSSGTFYKYPGNGLGTQKGRDRIPSSWTIVDNQTW